MVVTVNRKLLNKTRCTTSTNKQTETPNTAVDTVNTVPPGYHLSDMIKYDHYHIKRGHCGFWEI